jgi:hypothetical protein
MMFDRKSTVDSDLVLSVYWAIELGVERGRVDVEAGARLDQVGHDQADGQREGRDDLEVEQGLAADAADFLHVLHAGDTGDDGTEDHRRDDHLDQFDEAVSQGLHLFAECRDRRCQAGRR